MSSPAFRKLRSRAAPFAKSALLRVGAYGVVRRLLPSRRAAILRYHAICGAEGYAYADPAICISPAAFEQHAAYLAANYAVLSLAEIVERLRSRSPLPRNTVAITFDDGYADNLAAARTLNRHGLTATFFITAGCLAGGDPFWPAELRTLVGAIRAPELTLSLPDGFLRLPLGDAHQRTAAMRVLSRLFKSNPIPVRESIRQQLRTAAGSVQLPECMLQWSEVAELQQLGMTIGAHTLTHPNLPSAGLQASAKEIVGSKARLEHELGTEVSLFSYPNGGAERYYTPELQRLVHDAGYRSAATSSNGFAGPESDPYALERVQVHETLEALVFALDVERFAFGSGR